MSDPLSRLEVCRREIDRVFGDGHAAANPRLVTAVLAAPRVISPPSLLRGRGPERRVVDKACG